MKPAIIIGVTLGVSCASAEAHCYSVWRYPYPQHCKAMAYAPSRRLARTPILTHAPVLPPTLDIPLPDMSADWGGVMDTELELSLQRQRAIRQLTPQSN